MGGALYGTYCHWYAAAMGACLWGRFMIKVLPAKNLCASLPMHAKLRRPLQGSLQGSTAVRLVGL